MAKHLCVYVRPEGGIRSFRPRDIGVWGILGLWGSFRLMGCSLSSLEVSRDLKAEADAGALFSYNIQDYQPSGDHLKKCPTGLPIV